MSLGAEIVGFIIRKTPVYLTDMNGEIRVTYKTKNNSRVYVYHFTGVGDVYLKTDGTTSGASSYIEKWSYKDPRKEKGLIQIDWTNGKIIVNHKNK